MRNIIIIAVLAILGVAIWKFIEAQREESDPGFDSQEKLVKRLPNSVQHAVSSMSPDEYAVFLTDYKKMRRQTSFAYLMALLCGFHYAYVKKWLVQLLFWFTSGGAGLWWFIDLFRMPGIVRDANGDIARQVLSDLTVARNFASNVQPGVSFSGPQAPTPASSPALPPSPEVPPRADQAHSSIPPSMLGTGPSGASGFTSESGPDHSRVAQNSSVQPLRESDESPRSLNPPTYGQRAGDSERLVSRPSEPDGDGRSRGDSGQQPELEGMRDVSGSSLGTPHFDRDAGTWVIDEPSGRRLAHNADTGEWDPI